MKIVSVSRRTDIPAFYGEWFMNRVKAGYALTENPFNGKLYAVSLKPQDVAGFVFWSKNFEPFLRVLPCLEDMGYGFCFHYTITGLPALFEPSVPPIERSLRSFAALVEHTSPAHVFWRYDPILLSETTNLPYHIRRFETLVRALEGKTERCYISFPTLYAKVKRRFETLKQGEEGYITDLPLAAKLELVGRLAEISAGSGIALYSCCAENLVGETVYKAHCVDADTMSRLYPDKRIEARRNPSRKECGCSDSKDIGAYNSCPHGCLYCYANARPENAEHALRKHDPSGELLSMRNGNDYEQQKKAALQAIGWRRE